MRVMRFCAPFLFFYPVLYGCLLLLCAMALPACTSGSAWKPVDRWPPKSGSRPQSGQYVVQPGDTLYSIAWRYGMDYHQLAVMNQIGSPYVIRAGQILQLTAPQLPAGQPAVRDTGTGTGVAVIGGGSGGGGGVNGTGTPARPAYSAMKRSAVPAPGQAGSAAGRGNVAVRQPAPYRPNAPMVWLWPADGQVIGRFSDGARVNKGIDIGGKLGDSVHSTRSGVVVYAGNGLAGYGNLVIIKHDDVYLSAYAHNKTILVKEGQTVKAGDKIADIGSSGSAYPKLHFEIRRDGKPVNPIQLLPKR